MKEIRRAWSDEQILENLTNRSPKFTRNELIRDIAKYRGLGVEAAWVADAIIRDNRHFRLATCDQEQQQPL